MSLRPHYSPSRAAAGLVFVSGQLAFDAQRQLVGDTVETQLAQCLGNLARILAAEGLGLEDVVKTTVWLTRREDFAVFNSAYATYFPGTPPARSTVICELAAPGALIEVEAIAARRTV